MINAPVDAITRLNWMASRCTGFSFSMNTNSYTILADLGGENWHSSAGPLDDMAEAINECFYDVLAMLGE